MDRSLAESSTWSALSVIVFEESGLETIDADDSPSVSDPGFEDSDCAVVVGGPFGAVGDGEGCGAEVVGVCAGVTCNCAELDQSTFSPVL